MDKYDITEEEYNEICKNLKLDTETRNTLLTFSFTAVLTALGVALSINEIDMFVFILPFFVIIPFTGRLCYYRKWNAHMTSFLNVFNKKRRCYDLYTNEVKIDRGIWGHIVAWLVNYEMLFLAIACTAVFWVKYPVSIENFYVFDYLYCALPLLLTIFEFFLISSTYNYEKMRIQYSTDFEKIRNGNKE